MNNLGIPAIPLMVAVKKSVIRELITGRSLIRLRLHLWGWLYHGLLTWVPFMTVTVTSPMMVPTEMNDLGVRRKSFWSDVTWYVVYLGHHRGHRLGLRQRGGYNGMRPRPRPSAITITITRRGARRRVAACPAAVAARVGVGVRMRVRAVTTIDVYGLLRR